MPGPGVMESTRDALILALDLEDYMSLLRTGQPSHFKDIFPNSNTSFEAGMTRMVAMLLGTILSEAVRRGEDPFSSASAVAARAAQAGPLVTEAFGTITRYLAARGVALEGDGLGWRRRGLYDKGRRLVATKAFRPGDIILDDSSCLTMRYDQDVPERRSNGPNLI